MMQIKALSLQEDFYFPFWGTKVCLEIGFKPPFGFFFLRESGISLLQRCRDSDIVIAKKFLIALLKYS